MTLEQATLRAQAAAAAGNLESLHDALKARAAAIPAVRDRDRLQAAIEAGESIASDLRLFKTKLTIDINRLVQIRSALSTGLGAQKRTRISYRG